MNDPTATGSIHVEPTAKRVRVLFGGETIADSTEARLVWEHEFYPEYYFPRADVREELFAPGGVTAEDPALGAATNYTVTVGNSTAPDAARRYAGSPVEAIRGLIRFDWAAMDRWYEEDEEVFVHPRNPYARIDVLESRRHVQIEIDGVVVADSVRPKLLFETRMPTRYYLPQDDVRWDLLTPTLFSTRCPYKGVARYWTAEVNGAAHENVAWSYELPTAETPKVAGLICFYNEAVDIFVDGRHQSRPHTKFS